MKSRFVMKVAYGLPCTNSKGKKPMKL